jgi:hypothetical protein
LLFPPPDVLLGGKRIVFCQAMRGNGSGIGEKMDANAIGFAGALPIFVLLVIALAIWLQRQTG